MPLTRKEHATAELYADLHEYAGETFARDYLLPGFRQHLALLGLSPETVLRGSSFLDAGCGGFAGGVSVALALGAGSITGVDFSARNIAAAQQRFAGQPNVRFRRENLLALGLDDETFDFVYSNGVLMITEDPPRAFRELVRVLRPGGRLYIGVYGRGGVYNELLVPFLKQLGKIVPRWLTARALAIAPILRRPSSSLMDVMYVPLEIHYRIPEVERWFADVGMQPIFLRHYYQPDGLINRLLFGDGTMIFFSAVKPPAMAARATAAEEGGRAPAAAAEPPDGEAAASGGGAPRALKKAGGRGNTEHEGGRRSGGASLAPPNPGKAR